MEEEEKEKIEEKSVEHTPKKEISEQTASGKTSTLTGKMKQNPWVFSTLVLGIIALILLIGDFSGGGITGSVVSGDDAGNSILKIAQASDPAATISEVKETSGLYEIVLVINGREVSVFVTKDGENLVSGLTPLSLLEQQATAEEETAPVEIPKSAKPVVELFVMTHCPYGTQAEKGIIPTIEALGDKIDATIRFVHYFMHDPEEEETPRQICIREEQSDKWYDYLTCFLEDSDSDRCLTEAKIDTAELDACISSGKADEYYKKDSELSQGYGVRGSPTLIINGVQSGAGRSSASYLSGICEAFNVLPDECSETLSSAAPSPGFGYAEGADTSAQC